MLEFYRGWESVDAVEAVYRSALRTTALIGYHDDR